MQQLLTLTESHKILQNINNIGSNNIIIRGDFNFHFNSKLEANGKNQLLRNLSEKIKSKWELTKLRSKWEPTLKKKSIQKIIELIESFELSDTWRIWNPTKKRFTFHQNHISEYLQRRLDFFFVPNKLEQSIKNTDILASLFTDHSISFNQENHK